MALENANNLLRTLVARFQLGLRADFRNENQAIRIVFRPEGLAPRESFHIDVSIGWKTLRIEFVAGDQAGHLLLAMGRANIEKKAIFCAISRAVVLERGSLTMQINGLPVDPTNYDVWPMNWQQFSLSLKSPFIATEADLAVDEQLEGYLLRWVSIFLSMVIPLLPLDERPDTSEELTHLDGLPEGAKIQVTANRYERSRANRDACISFYGTKCQACGFDFEKTYGPIGRGYIEVHHVIPLSEIGKDYLVNPVKDLIPLCANCHAMVHRRTPPFALTELREILKAQNRDTHIQS